MVSLIDDVRGVVLKRGDLMRLCAKRSIDVDDVVQSVIVESLAKKKGVAFVEGETRRRYAANAAAWCIYDGARRAMRFVGLDETMPDPAPSPEDVAIQKQDREPIVAYVLASVAADPMLRGIRTGVSYAAAARDLGVAASTVTRRRDRLVEKIRTDQGIATQKRAPSFVYAGRGGYAR